MRVFYINSGYYMQIIKSHLFIPEQDFDKRLSNSLVFKNPNYEKLSEMGVKVGEEPTHFILYKKVRNSNGEIFYKVPRYALGNFKPNQKLLFNDPKADIKYNFDARDMNNNIFEFNTEQKKTIESSEDKLKKYYGCLIVAETGEGKCQKFDSLITYPGGTTTIKNFVEEKIPFVYSYDESTKKYAIDKAKNWVYIGKKKEYEVVFRSGKRISTSFIHKFLEENEKWRSLKNGLKEGNRVHSPRKLFDEKDFDRDILLIELMGLLLGDGCVIKCTNFISPDDELIERVRYIVGKYGLFLDRASKYAFRITTRKPFVGNNFVRNFLRELGLFGRNSHTKFIPEEVFSYSNRQVKIFLEALFNTDGCVYLGKRSWIEYTSVSFDIVQKIQLLLLRFGVQSIVKFKTNKYDGSFQLKIDGLNIDIFYKNFTLIERKQKILEKIANRKRNSNIDLYTLTEQDREILYNAIINYGKEKLFKELGVNYSNKVGVMKSLFPKSKNPSFERLLKIVKILNLTPLISKLENNYFDEIVEVREKGLVDMYDIETEKYHNYIANGILVHNTSCAVKIASNLGLKTLILCHKDKLAEQWRKSFKGLTKLKNSEIGYLKRGKFKDGKVVIGSIQSLMTDTFDESINDKFGLVILDEAHIIGAQVFLRAFSRFNPKYRLLLSATPNREDKLEDIYFLHSGRNIVYHESVRTVPLKLKIYDYDRIKKWVWYPDFIPEKTKLINNIIDDSDRNKFILNIVQEYKNNKILVLGERIAHLKKLLAMFEENYPNKKIVRFFGAEVKTTKKKKWVFTLKNKMALKTRGGGIKVEKVSRSKDSIEFYLHDDKEKLVCNIEEVLAEKDFFYLRPYIARRYVKSSVKTEEYTDPSYDDLNSADIVVATYKKAADGVDIPSLDVLIYASPFGSFTTLLQSAGRIKRKYKNKEYGLVIDIRDKGNALAEGLFYKRRRLLKDNGVILL